MSLAETVIAGTIQPDGTLILDEKLMLPAGRVQVILQMLPDLPDGDPFWHRMRAMWANQATRGHVPRSVDDVEAERRQTREDWENRMGRIEEIQAEAAALRKVREGRS